MARQRTAASAESIRLLAEMKANFFNEAETALMPAVDRAAYRVLFRFAAAVRKTAQRSMRRRKKSSRPGEPPSAKQGDLRKLILFAYDRSTKSAVVGAVAFPSSAGGKVPATHEYGGVLPPSRSSTIRDVLGSATPQRRAEMFGRANAEGLRIKDWLRKHPQPEADRLPKRPGVYPARPYIRPALDKMLPQFTRLFKDSVRVS
jgi:hypothetical protein